MSQSFLSSRPLQSLLAFLGAVIVVALAVVMVVDRAGIAQDTEDLHFGWSSLSHCLFGSEPLEAGEEPAERVRHAELALLTAQPSAEAAKARNTWLRSCSVHAASIHTSLSKESLRRQSRYAKLAAYATSTAEALSRQELPDETVLDGLVEAATDAGLAPKPVGTPERKAVHRPLLHDAAAPVLVEGSAQLVAIEESPGRAVRLGFAKPDGTRRACLFDRADSLEQDLSTFGCVDAPAAAGFEHKKGAAPRSLWIWSGAEALLTSGDQRKSLLERVDRTGFHSLGEVEGEAEGGAIDAAGQHLIVQERAGRWVSHLVGPAGLKFEGALPAVPASARWAYPVPGGLLWATASTRSSSDDALWSANLDGLLKGKATPEGHGFVPQSGAVASCRAGDTTLVLVEGRTSRPAVTRERRAVFLFHNARGWAPPVEVDAAWSADVRAGLASPRAPTLTCSEDEGVVTWADPENQTRVSQTRCSRQGCTTASALMPPEPVEDVLVADFAGKVVYVWNDVPHRIVRLRAAPLAKLAGARDIVLHDDAEAERPPGLMPSAPLHLFVRQSALIVLLQVARGDAGQVVAIRYDTEHEATFPQSSSSPSQR
jgi:hypothetical protein